MTEERARRRARLASAERGILVEPAADALTLYAVFTGVPLAVAAYCLTVQRAELGSVGLAFLLIGFAAGVPLALLIGERRRAAALITEIRATHPSAPTATRSAPASTNRAAPPATPGTPPHPATPSSPSRTAPSSSAPRTATPSTSPSPTSSASSSSPPAEDAPPPTSTSAPARR
ncbi:hypothetical protein OIM90_18805 [Streptomyces sp. AD16]|nr:hypothetical protein OIM90_18805 [Streptomyces sp. AD16]